MNSRFVAAFLALGLICFLGLFALACLGGVK